MKPVEFFEAVQRDQDLKGVAICPFNGTGEMAFVVEHVPSGYQTKIPFATVEKCDWQDIRQVIAGQREPNVLYHMSRIVGYYSRIENWNRSKIGELRDRHRGNYQVA